MSDGKVNRRILTELREHSKHKAVTEFLVDLVLQEADHSQRWRWREKYREQIEKYSTEWEARDET